MTLRILFIVIFVLIFNVHQVFAAEIALTFDDPGAARQDNPITWQQRTQKILDVLKKYNLKAALFVTGKRVDTLRGPADARSQWSVHCVRFRVRSSGTFAWATRWAATLPSGRSVAPVAPCADITTRSTASS